MGMYIKLVVVLTLLWHCATGDEQQTKPPSPVSTTNAPDACNVQEDDYLTDPKNPCSGTFYYCSNGKWMEHHCPSVLKFNVEKKHCDYEENIAACKKDSPTTTPIATTTERTTPMNTEGAISTSSTAAPVTLVGVPDTCNPAEDDYMSNPTNPCSGTFYQCSNGKWVEQQCPEDLKFNVATNMCDFEENVAACKIDTCNPAEDDYMSNPTNPCSGTFYQCSNGKWVEQQCPEDLKFNIATNMCDYEQNVDACKKDSLTTTTIATTTVRTTPMNTEGAISTSSTAAPVTFVGVPDTCNVQEDDYLPDPTNPCSGTFYQCSNGKWVPQECPEDLKFNVEINTCDLEENVDACKDESSTTTPVTTTTEIATPMSTEGPISTTSTAAPVTTVGDPDTCNPAEDDYMSNPTNPCSGTFYQCSNGKWVEQQCPEDLKFNIATNMCDYEQNVDACKKDSPTATPIAPTTVRTTPMNTEGAISTSSTAAPMTFVGDHCKTNPSGGCFWTTLVEKGKTNLSRARRTCAAHGSVLAVIPDQNTYDEIAEDIRKQLKNHKDQTWIAVSLWLGLTYDPATKTMHPDGAFETEWHPGFPNSNRRSTGILISVRLLVQSPRQGLKNEKPNKRQGGVVCWKPRIAE